MTPRTKHRLFVVDGSNIATEGRSTPSLSQLNEAVMSFMEDYPDVTVTVVVDATFGHRIAKKEVTAFDEAVANNELVTPPAGAVGRGDAFVLSIADKAGAGVLSNDSFQEFHGEYEWLFDDGRLIGGKPVPHVGWVFVERTPVRGPKSRQSVKAAKSTDGSSGSVKSDKERAKRRVKKKAAAPSDEQPADEPVDERVEEQPAGADDTLADAEGGSPDRGGRTSHVNQLMPFLEFVEHHPVGTSCDGTVDSYSSHGAYVRVDDVLVYLPLRLMAAPPPRSAREVLRVGDSVAVVIVGFVPDRRSIDAALPDMAPGALAAAEDADADADAAAVARAARAAADADAADAAPAATKRRATRKTTPAKKRATRKKATAKAPAKKKAPSKKRAAKKKAPAKTSTAGQTDRQSAAKKKTPARKRAATTKRAAKKKAPAKKKAAPRKTTARRNASPDGPAA